MEVNEEEFRFPLCHVFNYSHSVFNPDELVEVSKVLSKKKNKLVVNPQNAELSNKKLPLHVGFMSCLGSFVRKQSTVKTL